MKDADYGDLPATGSNEWARKEFGLGSCLFSAKYCVRKGWKVKKDSTLIIEGSVPNIL